MSDFHQLEMQVIRWAEANRKLKSDLPYWQASFVEGCAEECRHAIAYEKHDEISSHIGNTVIELIILAAMVDVDLSKCLEQSFNKIKKPEVLHD